MVIAVDADCSVSTPPHLVEAGSVNIRKGCWIGQNRQIISTIANSDPLPYAGLQLFEPGPRHDIDTPGLKIST